MDVIQSDGLPPYGRYGNTIYDMKRVSLINKCITIEEGYVIIM